MIDAFGAWRSVLWCGQRAEGNAAMTLTRAAVLLSLSTCSLTSNNNNQNYFHSLEYFCWHIIMGDSAYSFSLTTFSRTGKLLQIEYALNAVANGRTSLGICAKDGVVIATEKKLSSELVDVEQVHKVEVITPNTGFCYSGVGPDYRVLGKCNEYEYTVLYRHVMCIYFSAHYRCFHRRCPCWNASSRLRGNSTVMLHAFATCFSFF